MGVDDRCRGNYKMGVDEMDPDASFAAIKCICTKPHLHETATQITSSEVLRNKHAINLKILSLTMGPVSCLLFLYQSTVAFMSMLHFAVFGPRPVIGPIAFSTATHPSLLLQANPVLPIAANPPHEDNATAVPREENSTAPREENAAAPNEDNADVANEDVLQVPAADDPLTIRAHQRTLGPFQRNYTPRYVSLLTYHAPLPREVLSAQLGHKVGTHPMKHAVEELQALNLIESVNAPPHLLPKPLGRKPEYFQLTNQAFPGDRPPTTPLDMNLVRLAMMEDTEERKERRKENSKRFRENEDDDGTPSKRSRFCGCGTICTAQH
jgi:hypothetical protein